MSSFLPYFLISNGTRPCKAVVLMFWVANVSISQPVCSCVTWPNRYDAFCARVKLQQVEWIELERSVEQKLDVVQQYQIATGMLLDQFTQDNGGLQEARSSRHSRQPTAQLDPHVQWRDAPVLCQSM